MSDTAMIFIDCDNRRVNFKWDEPFGLFAVPLDRQVDTSRASLICQALAPTIKELMNKSREELLAMPRHGAVADVDAKVIDVEAKKLT